MQFVTLHGQYSTKFCDMPQENSIVDENLLIFLEAEVRIELTHRGFAIHCIPTLLLGHKYIYTVSCKSRCYFANLSLIIYNLCLQS